MLNATEECPVRRTDRQAMERNLEEVHRRLDEFEGILAADYVACRRQAAFSLTPEYPTPPGTCGG